MTTPEGSSELYKQLHKIDQMAARAIELSPYAEDEIREIQAKHRRELIERAMDVADAYDEAPLKAFTPSDDFLVKAGVDPASIPTSEVPSVVIDEIRQIKDTAAKRRDERRGL